MDYATVGPRCRPISQDTPPPRSVAANCYPKRPAPKLRAFIDFMGVELFKPWQE